MELPPTPTKLAEERCRFPFAPPTFPFIKEVPDLKVKMISLGEGNLDPSKLGFIAAMPTRDEALALIAMLTRAPVRDLACSVKDVPGRLVRVIAAMIEQKEAVA